MKKWRCTICDYVFVGTQPPEVCPVCGAGAAYFEPVTNEAQITPEDSARLQEVLLALPCGLFVVASRTADSKRVNGMIGNTVLQLTSTPLQVILGMDKQHWTTELIRESQVFSVMMLKPEQLQLVKRFGFSSGRDLSQDKFSGLAWEKGVTGVPVLKERAGYFECRVVEGKTLDAGTHLLFLATVVAGAIEPQAKVLTYQEYRRRKQELWD
ncbi:MAG TPA: flavin reductase [Bacillota bacterium]